jgi:hypothetical protein
MLTKEHPTQHGPWECLGAHALDGAVTSGWVPTRREMPSMVTRPGITSMAYTIRLNWCRVVPVTWGRRLGDVRTGP